MAGPLESHEQRNFSEGENPVANPFDLTDKQVSELSNMILDEHGSMRVRDGTLEVTTQGPMGTTFHPILKIINYNIAGGSLSKLAIVKGSGSSSDIPQFTSLYARNASPWTLIGAFTSNTNILPDALQGFNTIIACNAYETPRVYNGTTFVALTHGSGDLAPNGACHIVIHKTTLWLYNTAADYSVNSYGPDSLQGSDVNNFSSWPTSNQVFVSKGDGQQGQGLAQFTIAESGISPDSTLVAFKDFATYQISGLWGASNFGIQRVKTDMGCVAPRSIQFVPGFGVIRLTHRGFALFDGVNDTLISEQERPRIFGRDAFTGIDWSQVYLCSAAQLPNPPLYLCACPVAGQGGLTRVFCLDLVRRSWSILNFANPISVLNQVFETSPPSLPQLLAGDFFSGYVRRMFSGDATDDGTNISWYVVFRPITGQTVNDRLFLRRFMVDIFNMNSIGFQAQFQYPENPTGTNVIKTGPASSTMPVTIAFDYPGGLITNAVTVKLGALGGALGKIRGVSWQYRKKPITRSASGVW